MPGWSYDDDYGDLADYDLVVDWDSLELSIDISYDLADWVADMSPQTEEDRVQETINEIFKDALGGGSD